MKKYIVIILLLFGNQFVSCKREPTNIKHLTSIQINKIEGFPSSIGSYWEYLRYDSLSDSGDIDTILVKIVGDTIFNGKVALVQKTKYYKRNRIYYDFITIGNDTVKIFEQLSPPVCTREIVFPLEVGKGWKQNTYHDTSTVLDKVPITTFAGHFPNSYLIKESWQDADSFYECYIWFVLNIGIVKDNYRGYIWGRANSTWELIDYYIAPD